jgi:cystathionine beta-lyase
MRYDFDQLIDRRNSDSIKWNAYPEDVLPLWVADMDFVSPEPVIRALKARVEHGVFGYPVGLGGTPRELANLRGALVDRMQRLYGWSITPEMIIPVPGVVTGFNLAAHALAAPASSVLIQTPVYPPILHVGHETGVGVQEAPLTAQPDGSYTIDFAAFESAITSSTRMFILCNPHNPVGRVFSRDELSRMAEICLRHEVTIVSDEIHCDLVYPGHPHTPIAALDPEVAAHTITLIAPSKTFNIAGLESSFAIIPDAELRQQYNGGRRGLVGWVNLFGLAAAEAAYTEGGEWLEQMLAYLEGNRDYLHAYLQQHLPQVKMWKPEGTYLAWLDCRALDLPDDTPYQFFLKRAKVALNEGATFGPAGEGFVRLNFGCPRTTLHEALDRMTRAISEL